MRIMRRAFVMIAIFFGSGLTPVYTTGLQPLILCKGPTVIAFFAPLAQADVEKDADLNEVLSDFQFHTGQARESLHSKGIALKEIYARSFQLKLEDKTLTFSPSQEVGYYFVRPGKQPRVEYGVMTFEDILRIANEYFRSPSKSPPHR